MGAVDVEHRFPACSEQELRDRFARLQDSERAEYGSSPYSGTFATLRGLKISDRRFLDAEQARAWITPHLHKRENAIAAKIDADPDLSPQEKERLETLGHAKFKADRALLDLDRDTQSLTAIRQARSLRIGCKCCPSQLSRAHLKATDCPLCGSDLRSPTQIAAHERRQGRARKDVDRIVAEMARLQTRALARASKRDGETPWQWFVMGLAGS